MFEVVTDSIAKNEDFSNERCAIDSMVEGSVSPKTLRREDKYLLPFPEVQPRSTPDLRITNITVKSAVQYALKNSGYVVEVAIYRDWPDLITLWNPSMNAAVSIFHPLWDSVMGKMKEGADERGWDRKLGKFFDYSQDENENGFESFLAEVQAIQGFLCDATKEVEREPEAAAAAEAAKLVAERLAADEAAAAVRLAAEAALEADRRAASVSILD